MGIPLEECKQSYLFMKKGFKDELFDRMLQYGAEFGLLQLTYPSFRCVTNFASTLAATDLVRAHTQSSRHSQKLPPQRAWCEPLPVRGRCTA